MVPFEVDKKALNEEGVEIRLYFPKVNLFILIPIAFILVYV